MSAAIASALILPVVFVSGLAVGALLEFRSHHSRGWRIREPLILKVVREELARVERARQIESAEAMRRVDLEMGTYAEWSEWFALTKARSPSNPVPSYGDWLKARRYLAARTAAPPAAASQV